MATTEMVNCYDMHLRKDLHVDQECNRKMAIEKLKINHMVQK
jgi:hypothetical protein